MCITYACALLALVHGRAQRIAGTSTTCTFFHTQPPTVPPEAVGLRYTTSSHSLALPTPAAPTAVTTPPAQDSDPLHGALEHRMSHSEETGFTVNRPLSHGEFSVASGTERLPTPDISVQSLPFDDLHTERYTPPPGFGLNSPKQTGDARFEFSTPLIAGTVVVSVEAPTPVKFNEENALLTGIQEESEIESSMKEKSVASHGTANTIARDENGTGPSTQDDFDVPLPSTLPPPPPLSPPPPQNTTTKSRFSQFLNDIDSSLLELTGKKSFTPSAPLSEEAEPKGVEPQGRPMVRDPSLHSVSSGGGRMKEDIIDLGELVLEVSGLDGSNYGAQLQGSIHGRQRVSIVQDETDGDQDQKGGEVGDRLSPLPPAAEDDDPSSAERRGHLKITPSFLRSLLPPQEFSTDGEHLITLEGGARGQGSSREQGSAREQGRTRQPKGSRNSFTSVRHNEEFSPERGYSSGGPRTNTSSGSVVCRCMRLWRGHVCHCHTPCTHTHIHTCTHARTHTCTHAHSHIHTCTHAHMHAHTHAHTCTHMHTHAHTHAHTCTHMHTHMHTCTHACTHTCTHMHTHMHTHAHTCTHTCTHMHTHMHTHAHTCTHTCTHTRTHDCCTEIYELGWRQRGCGLGRRGDKNQQSR